VNSFSVWEFARAFSNIGEIGDLVVVLVAYFDDSGTHETSPLVCIGGLIGDESQWISFKREWKARLDAPLDGKPPLEAFHLTDCTAGYNEFVSYNQAERDRITYLFRQIILDTELVSFASTINRRAWEELIGASNAERFGTPEEFCFHKCVEFSVRTLRYNQPGQKIAVVFDQGIQRKIEAYASWYMNFSDQHPELAGIGFGKVNEICGLQGADTIATSSYRYGIEWMKNRESPRVDPHFRDFWKRQLSRGLIFDREQVEEWARRVRERFPI